MREPKTRLLFVVNVLDFFLSHRLPLALAALAEGHEVHVASAGGEAVGLIEGYGIKHHTVAFSRSGQNPLREIMTLWNLAFVFQRVRPDLVHLITIKPVLYGGIMARLFRIRAVVAAISGLGTVFIAGTLLARLRRQLVKCLYALAFKQRCLTVIFQNPDDRESLLKLGVLQEAQSRLIRGSGVALTDYPAVQEPSGVPVVVLIARLLRDKGVVEFVEAAQHLHQRGIAVVMRLIGAPDPGNPSTVSLAELDAWTSAGHVELVGFRSDIAAQYASAHIACLPSYREGLPKSLIEAAACGRAVVTTDVPGCRDAITPGITGLLVPVKNAEALADAIQLLVEDPALRQRMGEAGRKLAETEFTIEHVVEQHMRIYRESLVHA